MPDSVIEFTNVTKKFAFQSQKTFKEFLPALIKGEETSKGFIALDEVSFSIAKGETVGIIGPNGSGKSTILKLIAGVMSATTGKVKVHGSISPLIELGAGMHPELSGRENIYLNGAILGLKRRQIDAQLQSIIDFSEIAQFIDQPVKHYSSGMYMRLAFAIAVHVDPEILIVDEILAVGDEAFQAKCFKRMEEFKQKGVTIIFVSHNLTQIKNFCSRAIYIRNSKLIADGTTSSVCQKYLDDNKNN